MRDKRPAGRVFSWSRSLTEIGVVYRLFRRDLHGALHMQTLSALASEPRQVVAAALRIVKRSLRDQVDEIDLQIMEQAA